MPAENRGPEVAGVAGAFLLLTTIAIALRCYCRAFVVKSFGWDDNAAIVAYVRTIHTLLHSRVTNRYPALLCVLCRVRHYRSQVWHWTTRCRYSTSGHSCRFEVVVGM